MKAFPIQFAGCMTIALAQGSEFGTCDVVVHFPPAIFAAGTHCGTAYVALSRVADISQLYVENLQPGHVRADGDLLR